MRRNNIYLSVAWGENGVKEILEIINLFSRSDKRHKSPTSRIHWVSRGKMAKLENNTAKEDIKRLNGHGACLQYAYSSRWMRILKNHVMVVCASLCFATNYFTQWLKTIYYFSWFCELSGWFYCYCYLCSCTCIFLMCWLEAALGWDSWVSLSTWSFILDFFTTQWSWGRSGSCKAS